MSFIESLAIILGIIWIAALTLLLILTVRQVVIISEKLNVLQGTANAMRLTASEGPAIGSRIGSQLMQKCPGLADQSSFLLLLSGNCEVCHEFARAMRHRTLDFESLIVALVPGETDAANDFIALFPQGAHVISDPDAAAIANELNMQLIPSILSVREGIVNGKLQIPQSVDDMVEFVEPALKRLEGAVGNLTQPR